MLAILALALWGAAAAETTAEGFVYAVPDGVRVIGPHAFLYAGIRSLTLPDSVTGMGDFAFACCERLRSVTVPGSLRRNTRRRKRSAIRSGHENSPAGL